MKNMKRIIKKISVIIPALNEEFGIGKTIELIPRKEISDMGYQTEIVVVDNGSTDNTARIAHDCGAKVVSEQVRGYGNAYKAGINNATGDLIITGDADMTYPFDDMPRFIKMVEKNNFDFINTNRLSNANFNAMANTHILGNYFLSAIARFIFNWPFNDSQSGMWIFKKDIWKYLDVRSGGMSFSQEIKIEAYIKGFKCTEVPIVYRRRVGEVKLNAVKDGLKNVMHLFIKRFTACRKDCVIKDEAFVK